MKKVKRQKSNGITLIALVITIIVLLILAGVTIATLTGENGILTKATDAKVETRGASVEEARDIWKSNQQMDLSTGEKTAQTLEELLEDLEEQKLITEKEKNEIEETGKVTIGSRTIEFKELTLKEQIQIGDYVNYFADNRNYNINIELDEGNSTVKSQTFSTEENIRWRVLKKIGERELLLISDRPTTAKVELGGIEGYNFGVSILDDTCSALYCNRKYNCVARNIKLSDIEIMLKEETLKKIKETPNSENVCYGEEKEYTVNKNYPSLFECEIYGEIDGQKLMEGMNNEESYIGISDRIRKANTSLKIIQTGYDTQELVKNDFSKEIFYELLFGKDNENFDNNFHISTRTITAKRY